ncbi:hypothetical protein KM915_06140 [Cytobacillus oceanisediminis]|jgi:hypothetical protein|uniref:hypothetical protein n=2 Tax=Bacillaceae TaxID=186817 RepID=UPI0018641EC7|nr:hypothetical protein [Cytobacillus oceanisediminis]MBY0155473.1 hypothetical protein [Cytobacillus firmus]QOK29229.1 hypothetical protein IIE26_11465 [Cytobacillus oceanisediminis]
MIAKGLINGRFQLMFILFIPVFWVQIWSYFDPEESLLWGKWWMYKEEPEKSEGAIRYTKMMCMIVLTVIFAFGLF